MQTHRQTYKQTHRQIYANTCTRVYTETHTDKHADIRTNTLTERHAYTQTIDMQCYAQTNINLYALNKPLFILVSSTIFTYLLIYIPMHLATYILS